MRTLSRPRARWLAGSTLVWLAACSTAQAGTPFTIGTTSSANDAYSLTMDRGSGTAYVVLTTPNPADVIFCRIPRGATACATSVTLTLDTDPGPAVRGPEEPWILRDATTGTLTILDSRYVAGDVRRWQSVDDGATWSESIRVSDAAPGTDSSRPVLMAGGFAVLPTTNIGKRVNRVALDGSSAIADPAATLSSGAVDSLDYDLGVAPAAGTELVATGSSLNSTYSWLLPTGQNPDTTPAWSAGPTLVAAGETEPRLAAGGGATYLFTRTPQGRAVRRWTGGGFGPPTALAAAGASPRADASGDGDAAVVSASGDAVQVALSVDNGATFGTRTVALGESAAFPDVAIANDGQGLAIWRTAGNVLRAADLTDVTPVVPVPGPGTSTPIPSVPPTGVPTGPGTGTGGLPTKITTKSNGGTFTVTGPKTCIQPGRTFRVTMSVKRQKRKGNLFVKVTKVDFSVAGKIVKTDRKAPFRQTLRVTPTARPGGIFTVRARAHIKVRKTKKIPKKSVFLRIRVCAA